MSLADLRGEVQRIDEDIIEQIDERVKLAGRIIEAKKAEGIKIEDPDQEKLVLKRAMDMATERGLDAGAVKQVFQTLIKMNLEKQHELRGEDNFP